MTGWSAGVCHCVTQVHKWNHQMNKSRSSMQTVIIIIITENCNLKVFYFSDRWTKDLCMFTVTHISPITPLSSLVVNLYIIQHLNVQIGLWGCLLGVGLIFPLKIFLLTVHCTGTYNQNTLGEQRRTATVSIWHQSLQVRVTLKMIMEVY